MSILDVLARRIRNEEKIQQVWDKGKPIPGYDRRKYRWDIHYNLMIFSHYGRRDSIYGWEIDHFIPRALKGRNHIGNLRPLNWYANTIRGIQTKGLLNR